MAYPLLRCGDILELRPGDWKPGNATKANGEKFYVLGNDVACFAEGVEASSNFSDVPGCGNRRIANIARLHRRKSYLSGNTVHS